jgi:hypothetical protein
MGGEEGGLNSNYETECCITLNSLNDAQILNVTIGKWVQYVNTVHAEHGFLTPHQIDLPNGQTDGPLPLPVTVCYRPVYITGQMTTISTS